MSWSAARIEKDILLTGLECLAISPYEIVSAFERVERVLGHEWLTARISARGIAPTTEVVGMGLLSCLSWKWRRRSSVKITERTYEKRAQALHR
jgi:hypothetical protein